MCHRTNARHVAPTVLGAFARLLLARLTAHWARKPAGTSVAARNSDVFLTTSGAHSLRSALAARPPRPRVERMEDP